MYFDINHEYELEFRNIWYSLLSYSHSNVELEPMTTLQNTPNYVSGYSVKTNQRINTKLLLSKIRSVTATVFFFRFSDVSKLALQDFDLGQLRLFT